MTGLFGSTALLDFFGGGEPDDELDDGEDDDDDEENEDDEEDDELDLERLVVISTSHIQSYTQD